VAYEGHENRPDVIEGSITVLASAIRRKQRQQASSVLERFPNEMTAQDCTPYFLAGPLFGHSFAPGQLPHLVARNAISVWCSRSRG
jgi:hypothetical protein